MRLGDGAGWKRVVRGDLANAKSGRAGRRTALASFVQFTDLHLMDTQHPLRLEYLRSTDKHAWRPHEALTVQGGISLVERVNALRGAPVTGSPLHFVMTTGDNTDNNAKSELEWFLKIMSGGRFTPNTGDPRHYEGVMNSGLKLYWQPDSTVRDGDKQVGFPHLKGFLAAAIREVRSPGLNLPWYSTVGNHDALPLGCFGSHADPYLTELAIGGKKLMTATAAEAKKLQNSIRDAKDPKGSGYRDFLKAHARSARSITPDENRAPYTSAEYLKAHLDPAYQGLGPVGHGYSSANVDSRHPVLRVPYRRRRDRHQPRHHGRGRPLRRVHRGNAVEVAGQDTPRQQGLVRGDLQPPHQPDDGQHPPRPGAPHRAPLRGLGGHRPPRQPPQRAGLGQRPHPPQRHHPALGARRPQLLGDLHRLARRLPPTRPRHRAGGQQGRHALLFTTLIESAAPHRTDFSDLTQTGLAALYRELSYNAPGSSTVLGGHEKDRNTELLLKKG